MKQLTPVHHQLFYFIVTPCHRVMHPYSLNNEQTNITLLDPIIE